ncbi:MAG: hypothetical protein RLZZ519_396 [Bacteroidota bacterium]|jgi:hypothetical protein
MNGLEAKGRWVRWMLLVMLCGFIAPHLPGQNRVHIGVGFNQSYAPLDSLNYVLQSFNAENDWTDAKPMHSIHMPAGLTAHMGADFAGVLVDFHYTMRMASTRSKGPLSGSLPEPSQEIIVRYNASTMDLGIGVFFIRKPRFRMAIGQSIDFGNVRISGKRGPSESLPSQIFGRFVNELNLGTTSFLHTMIAFQDGVGPGIFIRPYFQFGLYQNDYGPLNRAIRPIEYLNDPLFILGRQTNAGLKVGVFFGS